MPIRADGQDVLTWFPVPQPELSYVCKEQEAPQLEVIQLGDQSAILIKSAGPSFMQLFLRVGDAYYVVGGQVALNELLQLATSISGEKVSVLRESITMHRALSFSKGAWL